jgi:broad specificity phosphatase PhoE
MTIIYLTRHTKPDKTKYKKSSNELEQNKTIELSEEGKIKAQEFFKKQEFQTIEKVYTSDYIRAQETGKIFKNKIIIDKRLGERIPGIPDTSLTPSEYFNKQIKDKNFKFKNGESRKQIENRMYEAIKDIIKNNENEKILVISHGAAITFLLMKFCNIEMTNIENKIRKITFKNRKIFEKNFDYLETFKLTFEKDKLINIESVGNINENI